MITQKLNSLFSFYNNSYATALMDLFPEVGIDPTKFIKIKRTRGIEVLFLTIIIRGILEFRKKQKNVFRQICGET